ncbi:MAG: creatininase family protein [Anaerolineales bacterium]
MLYDAEATYADLEAAKVEIAILSIGAIEQHSLHLPLGTDWIGAEALARRVAERLGRDYDVYLLPGWPYSLSQCHGPMPGTVWLKPETLADVLCDAVRSLYEQGIRRVVVINGHGGNFVLDAEIRELNLHYPDLILLSAASWGTGGGTKPTGRVIGGDIHAGEGETASQLYLNPQHVSTERVDYVPPVGREFLDYAYMCHISPHGVWGRPSRGTAQAGKVSLERVAETLAQAAEQAFEEIAALKRREEA